MIEDRAGQLDQVDDRREQAGDARAGQLGGDRALVLAPEARQLAVLRAGGLHERGVAERLLGDGGQRAAAAAALAGGAAGEPREAVRGEVEERDDDERGERELPREQEERAAEEEDPRGGLDELAGGRQQQRLDRVHVAR